jgi:hypothetical protein
MKILYALLWVILTLNANMLIAEEDPDSFLWKQGTLPIFDRGIAACNTTKILLDDYKTFAGYGVNGSKFIYKEAKRQYEEDITYFQVAEKHYAAAELRYKEALQMLLKARAAYQKGKSSASRTQDRDLITHQTLANNQLRIASKIYKDAKYLILLGNREFNQATRYYNDGAQLYKVKTGEEIPIRRKFHRWPAEKL